MKLRFAPSPTGYIHVGNARTLLINWLYARHHSASFYLRFDDTDRERSKHAFEEQIIEDLNWLGLSYDAVFRQSERLDIYTKAAEQLKSIGRLYPCYEAKEELEFKRKRLLAQKRPPIYDRAALKLTASQVADFEKQGRQPHWRFLLKEDEIKWDDLTHGTLSFQASNLSDPILLREDGTPIFTLSGMVDDLEMGITHILRGNDHITNTAIQIQILEALGGKNADFHFGHVPLLTSADGEGFSKRLGSLSLQDLRSEGYESLSILNYLASLGLSEEMPVALTLDTLAKSFDLQKLGRASPKFSLEGLDRTNTKILHTLSYTDVQERLKQEGLPQITPAFWEMVKDNLMKLKDIEPYLTTCFGEITPVIQTADKPYLEQAIAALPSEPWSESTWHSWTQTLKEKSGRKGPELFMPLRQALTGDSHGPEMKKLLPFISPQKVIKRLSGERA
jgi:glutamyl-tRNA synthetase